MLTTIEKYILESIQNGFSTILDIHLDTKLDPLVINKYIRVFRNDGFVIDKQGKLELNPEANFESSNQFRTFELTNIVKNNIGQSIFQKESQRFRIETVFFNKEDEKIFNAMMINLEDFILNAKKNYKNIGKTSEKKVIFWGRNTYHNLIKDIYLNDTNCIA